MSLADAAVGAWLAGAGFAGAFLARAFLAGAFFVAVFLAGGFFVAVFLGAVFLDADFWAALFFAGVSAMPATVPQRCAAVHRTAGASAARVLVRTCARAPGTCRP
jgi:hypothetical protein